MADAPIDCDFPIWGLLPKKETGVVSFLNKTPEYDGRNTIIAIFDSGVDPAADGLKVTSTGETKVIERFDCSGCGDVDTSTIIRKVVDGCITGITGRKLKIPESWSNPTGVWRTGVVYPYSLYPGKLRERVQEHRRRRRWDERHRPALAAAIADVQAFETELGSKTNLTSEEKQKKEELEARVEVLTAADKKYNDLGPTYDCVLFHDGTVWRACIDTSETGELSSGPLLGEFSVTHEHAQLTALDEMTVTINVHDDGDTLEVVGMCSSHGTHVAAIAAGYYPDEPDRSGVAPGAKIVSLTIGDSRLGSMETGTALVRACIKVMELSKTMKIDVINMSYGEHAHWSNTGRIGDIIKSVVSRYGVSWVVSAGNHGPALGTVGAPPDIAHDVLIGVGAYVSPDMMSAAYSMAQRGGGGAFSWSSRGPCADGAAGVSVAAPGGAVAAVARFTLRNTQLMNGTSMAAPHVAGVVAALISGLKAKDLPYSPYSIKRALENSATFMPHVEPWAQGAGLVNIEKAFEHLTTYHAEPERDVTFSIQCGPNNGKGILWRPAPGDEYKDVAFSVEPQFMQDYRDADNTESQRRQIALELRLAFTAASWVRVPAHAQLSSAARSLSARLQVQGAGPHYTSINAYDVNCPDKGPVFRIPVTVLTPHPLPDDSLFEQKDVVFKPSTIKRHFFIAPPSATWGVVRLRATEGAGSSPARFLLHTMQLAPRRSCREHETQKMISLTHDQPVSLPFAVIGGLTIEVAIAKYWAHIGSVIVDYSIEFRGIGPRGDAVWAGAGITRVLLYAHRTEDALPQAQLKTSEPIYRPAESKLTPLTKRDVIPPGRQIYQLINTYNFHVAKATEVVPVVSILCDMLYESELESQMWMIYNNNKQLMAVGDAYPTKYSVKLEKGDYVLRLNVRHDNKALLDKLLDAPLGVQHKLAQPLTLDAYADHALAITGGKKFSSATVHSSTPLPIYFTPAPSDKISRSNLTIGHTLTGTVTFAKDELGRKVDTYPLHYVVMEPPKRNNNNSKDKSKAEDYAEALKEFTISWLSKLEGDKLDEVYSSLVSGGGGDAAAHVAYLLALDPPTDHKRLPRALEEPDVTTAWCEQIISISDKVIKQIDQEKLLAYLGMKNDTRSDASKIKQEQEKQRGYLLDALSRRGAALCRLHALRPDRVAALHSAHADVMRFTDLTDTKVINYGVWHCFTLKHWGRAIKLLNKMQEERPSKEVEERLLQAYQQLGWTHLADHTLNAMPTKYPNGYRPF